LFLGLIFKGIIFKGNTQRSLKELNDQSREGKVVVHEERAEN
jgi:hypothetical protein